MKIQIALGIALAAIVVTSIAIANNNSNMMTQELHESHHNGNGMMGMMNMMNGNVNWEEMHEQCESSMTEEAHEQCESIMESSGCPMMG